MLPRQSVPLHSEDQAILDDARQLCRQLGIYKKGILGLNWTDRVEFYRTPPDHVLIFHDELILPKHFMGKLTAEEWRPLVASALIHSKILKQKFLRGILRVLVPAFLIMFLGTYVVEHIFPNTSLTSTIAINASLFFGIGLIVLALVHQFRLLKRFYLEADGEAGELLGVDHFINVLKKMDSIGIPRTAPARDQPSIWERIRNLEITSNASGPTPSV
jgi:hypothetical protein